jgi:hypothetical protein
MTAAKPSFDFRQRAAQDCAGIARWELGRIHAVMMENRNNKVTIPCAAIIQGGGGLD